MLFLYHEMKDAEKPIGIFDSGIGGLTVANAIQNVLPNESLIYFGDTEHLPYGEKSPEAILHYSLRIADFLLEHNCKIIVIACNTASSIAYEAVKDHLKGKALTFDVINPVTKNVASKYSNSKIGVIATKATIKSDVYSQKIKQLNSSLEVASLATPLLVPMIEEGFYNNKISKAVIASYLEKAKLKNIKALILACTHFPLIKPEIEDFYKGKVDIVNSAEIVADHIKEKLIEFNLSTTKKTRKCEFYVSDYTKSFEESTRFFFKGKINLKYYPLWEAL
jgi:glutamate racemase